MLRRRYLDIHDDALCVMCDSTGEEDIEHLSFITCPFAIMLGQNQCIGTSFFFLCHIEELHCMSFCQEECENGGNVMPFQAHGFVLI